MKIMAAILMMNVPYAGHTNPTLPLAEAQYNRMYRRRIYTVYKLPGFTNRAAEKNKVLSCGL